MSSVNRVTLLGRLGADPEVRYLPNGGAVCNLNIATSRKWKDKQSGDDMEETEWSRVVLYERQAEIAGEYLRKGYLVYIEGRLRTRDYEAKDNGGKRYVTEIIGQQLQLMPNKDREDEGGGQHDTRQQQRPAQNQQRSTGGYERQQSRPQGPSDRTAQRSTGGGGGAFDGMDDDVPFIADANATEFSAPKTKRLNRAHF